MRSGAWDEWILVGPDPKGKYRRLKPGIRLLAHGIPARIPKLRAFGNSIVPWLAAEVIRAWMDVLDAV
jgi:DNA (cytosine-5)-methyltransferase 1